MKIIHVGRCDRLGGNGKVEIQSVLQDNQERALKLANTNSIEYEGKGHN